MACPYFLLSRYDFSCLRQRKLESDADTVETTNSVGKPCSDSQIDPLKSRIVARWSVFLGKPLESKAIKMLRLLWTDTTE